MSGPLEEWHRVAAQFGVGIEQVRRDHLISHVLAALARSLPTDDVVFFGGTALSRTFLVDARLSEDVDLIALAPRAEVARAIEHAVARGLARTHGRVSWRPALTATTGSRPAVLLAGEALGVQVQLVPGAGYLWPTEVRAIEQRYADAPPARLRTLTASGFAAAKLAAWMDRRASRDLYDMWALAERGHIGSDAMDVFTRFGPTARAPEDWVFASGPTQSTWEHDLAHQTVLMVTASEALARVADAWSRARAC